MSNLRIRCRCALVLLTGHKIARARSREPLAYFTIEPLVSQYVDHVLTELQIAFSMVASDIVIDVRSLVCLIALLFLTCSRTVLLVSLITFRRQRTLHGVPWLTPDYLDG